MKMKWSLLRVALMLALSLSGSIAFADQKPEGELKPEVISFHNQIRPLFQAKCVGCHQPAKQLGDYLMTSFDALVRGGETGDAAIVPGKPDESYLIEQITPVDGAAEMPKNGDPLRDGEVALIRKWIEQGASDDTPESAKVPFSPDNPPKYVRPPVITSLDFSPDGSLLAVSGFSEVLLHRANSDHEDTLVARLIGVSDRIESVRFSPNGKLLAVCGGSPGTSGEVQIWDVATHKLVLSLPVTFDTIYGASWSPDGTKLAFGCADATVRAIDVATGQQILYQGSHNDWVFDTVFSKDGSHLVSVAGDMTAKLIEVKTQRFVDNITSITPKALKGGINSVVRHSNRDEILFGGADGIPKIYQMHRTTDRKIGDDANLLWELPALPGRIFGVDWSDDASCIVAGSSLNGNGAVHIYGIDPEYKAPDDIKAILQKPTHQRSADELAKMSAYFAEGIKTRAKIDTDAGIYAVAISPDGQRVAASGSDGQIRILNAADGTELRRFLPVKLESTEQPATDVAAKPAAKQTVSLAPESLPDGAQVTGILVEPAEMTFSGPNQYTQIIVSATLASGDVVDVTRICNLRVHGQPANVTPSGVVTPAADGNAELVATLGSHSSVGFVHVSGVDTQSSPDYVRDVMPVISRMGCNAGTCHGSKDGKNGFKLSLRGYDPIYDIRAFTDDIGSRRVNLASPDDSLMLLKCTSAVPHSGGQLTTPDSKYYQIVRNWIAAGAKLDLTSPRVTSIAVSPVNPVVQQIGSRQQVRVVATYADGQTRDVTQEAFIESGNTDIAKPVKNAAGLIEVLRRGEAPLLVRFEGNYAATTVTVMGDRSGFEWVEPPQNNPIDGFVAEKLERTKTLPSHLCNDYEFIRRVHLDLTGLPPTAEQIRSFVNDKRDSRWKRDELVDSLIGSDAYVEHWSNKWADLLQVNRKFLGQEGAAKFREWIREQVEQNTPYDQFVREILTATGSNLDNPAASYFKILRTPEDTMENTTHLFLATRFNCNKCHDHPFERWTQDQYYEMAAFFAQVDLKRDDRSGDQNIGQTAVESGKPLYEIVLDKTEGEVKHDRTGEVTAPNVPYATDADWNSEATRREQLAAWITSPDNQYFARSYVNRLWGYLTGTGIIEPIDDIRAGNPPTNPELLEWLTQQFLDSNFDTQHIIRTICKSRTYQLSIEANQWNSDDSINYSHAMARRLPAEVLYDSILLVTGAQSKFPGVPTGTRAAALPDVGVKLPDGFLGNLGRPARESACECERSNELQLGPVMALVSGPTVGEALANDNALESLVKEFPNDRELFNELFVRILNRPATDREIAASIDTMSIMEEEHLAMSKRLEQMERDWKPKEAELESARWANIAKAEAALNAYLDETRAAKEKATQDREDRIAAAEMALARYQSELPQHLATWEEAGRLATEWSTLDFTSMKASFGATLEQSDDGSVFASGENGRGNYDLESEVYGSKITGIRIEALADERLPKMGPGRADDGNFVLSELKLQWADPTRNKETEIAKWSPEKGLDVWQPNDQLTVDAKSGILQLKSTGNDPILTHKFAGQGEFFMLEIEARLSGSAQSQLFWSTKSNDSFAEDRSVTLALPGDGQWLPYRYYFRSGEDLTGLRFDPNNKAGELAIRQIKLVRIDGPDFTDAKLVAAKADFSQNNYDVQDAIDGKNDDNNDGWAISPNSGKSHQAIFTLNEPIGSEFGARLKLQMMQNYRGNNYSLGKFRISVTTSPAPLDFGLPGDVKEILATAKADRSEEQGKRLLDYFAEFSRRNIELKAALETAKTPLPEDKELKKLEMVIATAKEPIKIDSDLVRLRNQVAASSEQLKNKRLTAAQDVSWALINNPAFLFNH